MEIKKIRLKELKKEQFSLFKKLLLPALYTSSHLEKQFLSSDDDQKLNSNEEQFIAFAAFENQEPVALLVAKIKTLDKSADLISLFVEPKKRGQKIGSKLLETFQLHLEEIKCEVLTFVYDESLKTYEPFLEKQGFTKPTPFIYRYFFDPLQFNPMWYQKLLNDAKKEDNRVDKNGINFFLWSDLSEQERLELKKRQQQWSFPPEVSPFVDEENIEFSNSLGLKKKEEIIGWIIIHRSDEDLINYSSLYIEQKYRHFGNAIKLLVKAIALQKKAIEKEILNKELQKTKYPRFAEFYLNLHQTDLRWQDFIKKRLEPFAQKTILFYLTFKKLI